MILNMNGGSGEEFKVNGLVDRYMVASGNTINAGDFVSFQSGKIGSTINVGYTDHSVVYDAIKLSDGRIFVVGNLATVSNNFTAHYSFVTINGATCTNTTPVNFNTGCEYDAEYVGCSLMDDGRILFAYADCDNYVMKLCILTVNGNTVSRSNNISLPITNFSATSLGASFIRNIGDNRFLYVHKTGRCYVVTVNGNTISYGNEHNINANLDYGRDIVMLSNSKFVCIYKNGSSSKELVAKVFTINGTNISSGSAQTIYTYSDSRTLSISACAISSSKIFVTQVYHSNGDGTTYGMVCEINDTTITAGTNTTLIVSNGNHHTAAYPITESKVLLVYSDRGSIVSADCLINGTTVSMSNSEIWSSAIDTEGYKMIFTLGDGTLIYLASSKSMYHIACGVKSSDTVVPLSSSIYGVAKDNGSGGVAIDVYIPSK